LDSFLFVDRKELAAISEKLIDRTNIAKKSSEAKYTGYNRWNRRKELTGMIKSSDLLTLTKNITWKKLL